MNSNPPTVLKLNAMKAINGCGVVIAVLVGFILVIPGGKGAGPGFAETQGLFYYVLPLPALMILATKRILIDPPERRIRITKGIWPFVFRNELPFEESPEIQLDATTGRWISYSALLSLPNLHKPIPILADGDEDQLRSILDFARKAGFRLRAKDGLRKFAPDLAGAIDPDIRLSS